MKLYCLLLLISFSAFAENNAAELLCGKEFNQKSITSPWKKNKSTFDEDFEGYCVSVRCRNSVTELNRTKCFAPGEHPNIIKLSYQDNILEKDRFRSNGTYQEVRLHEGEACLDACVPVEKKAFGMKMKTESGLDRESCRSCFMNRDDQKYDGSYFYQAIGKKLYNGQWCSDHCLVPKGEIVTTVTPSLACQKCVGINGYPGEKFKYLLRDKNCFEVNSENRLRVVPINFCGASESLMKTTYKYKQSGNFIFGISESCEEIDIDTEGELLRKKVSMTHCKTEPVDDSDRSVKQVDEPEEKFKSRSSSKQ